MYASAIQQCVAVRLALRDGGLLFIRAGKRADRERDGGLLFIRADERADGESGADRVHRAF
jgi:hypothetical protein